MNKINDGGPAFPIKDWHKDENDHNGMSLRDYFAAKAMQSLSHVLLSTTKYYDVNSEHIAKHSYFMADAMLKAREDK